MNNITAYFGGLYMVELIHLLNYDLPPWANVLIAITMFFTAITVIMGSIKLILQVCKSCLDIHKGKKESKASKLVLTIDDAKLLRDKLFIPFECKIEPLLFSEVTPENEVDIVSKLNLLQECINKNSQMRFVMPSALRRQLVRFLDIQSEKHVYPEYRDSNEYKMILADKIRAWMRRKFESDKKRRKNNIFTHLSNSYFLLHNSVRGRLSVYERDIYLYGYHLRKNYKKMAMDNKLEKWDRRVHKILRILSLINIIVIILGVVIVLCVELYIRYYT